MSTASGGDGIEWLLASRWDALVWWRREEVTTMTTRSRGGTIAVPYLISKGSASPPKCQLNFLPHVKIRASDCFPCSQDQFLAIICGFFL